MGTGHLWPVLSGERGEYELAAGRTGQARSLLASMQAMQSGQGLEPEQAWEDPALAANVDPVDGVNGSIGFENGQPAGSASPLTWAQAQYARLAIDLTAGRDVETPDIVSDRYVTRGMPGTLPLAITSPAPGASISTATVTVTGTTTPGATVDAEGASAAGGTASTATTTAGANGQWTLALPASFGSTTITVTATKGRATGYAQEFVTNVALPGTQKLSVTDPPGDDHGPGTYQYPTASDFQAGAFDLLGLKVSQDATNTYIQAHIANLASTFGSDFGAQLLDVYVHDPSATTTSTGAAYSQMNYSIAPADAWSQRLEAQGFAPVVWQDASGNAVGTAQFIVDQPSGTATLVVPNAQFGTVGSGWTFTVALTGQGSGNPPIRHFAPTPQSYSFGVCASGNSAPICSYDPNKVPAVMDTITPSGVSQSTELNPLNGSVVLQGVTVP